MDKILIFSMPLFLLAAIMIPLFVCLKRIKQGKPVHKKRSVVMNIASFFGVLVVVALLPLTGAFAEGAEAAADVAAASSAGMKYLGAALSTGLGSIGTGIAVGGAAPAAIGAVSENDKSFSKALIFVALGEGVAIYGLLISILILFG